MERAATFQRRPPAGAEALRTFHAHMEQRVSTDVAEARGRAGAVVCVGGTVIALLHAPCPHQAIPTHVQLAGGGAPVVVGEVHAGVTLLALLDVPIATDTPLAALHATVGLNVVAVVAHMCVCVQRSGAGEMRGGG